MPVAVASRRDWDGEDAAARADSSDRISDGRKVTRSKPRGRGCALHKRRRLHEPEFMAARTAGVAKSWLFWIVN